MVFLTSRSVSKHILFAVGVDPATRDSSEGRGSNLISQATPFAESCETSSRAMASLVSPNLARRKVWFLALQWLRDNRL